MKRLLLFAVILIACGPLFAEESPSAPTKRALVIGNAAYSATPLKNTVNDARDMGSLLRALGFSTSILIDADRDAMNSGLQKFIEGIEQGDTALFYYSGHGFQLRGANYLIPVDATLRSIEDVPYSALSVDALLAKLADAKSATNIVILDACRNNPFPGSERSQSRGLASEDYPIPGTIVVYATSPGAVASEGDGRNGVFTESLLKRMRSSGLDIESMLRLVRDDVIDETAGTQIPWSSSSLRGKGFYFLPPADASVEAAAPSGTARASETAMERAADALVGGAMLRVDGGGFLQGSDSGDEDEKPVHETKLDDYLIALYETSYAEYDAYCDAAGKDKPKDSGSGRSEHPVAFVSWFDAIAYCNWRSQKEGLESAYDISRDAAGKIMAVSWKRGSDGYRLPTEAEWEYAARGGQKRQEGLVYPGSAELDEIAWYIGNSGKKTGSVGTKLPNALGIYDLAGNVWEWCWDWYGPYRADTAENPAGAEEGKARILRGGGYNTATLAYYSVSNRGTSAPVRIGSDIGFRVARSLRK